MSVILTEADLADAIELAEQKHKKDGVLLVEEFNQALLSLKPVNVLKNIFTEITTSGELKDNLVNTSAGVAAGYAAKMLVAGKSAGLVRNIAGNALQFGISNVVSRNPETIKLIGNTLLLFGKQLFRKKQAPDLLNHQLNNESVS
ncbi:hypothetical protein [Lacibacter sediminis]|uniref:Uncharacterized protein n=1 Tax=Lacibacter sediminis TaxID=2760713 RepID=A0A7G5XCX6_9BACT|nr:hypothetical protein [Lacibacter sediminis]QNA43329.1 hypothetical protein H4075_14735 [Lacibacter sediminis]